MIHSIHACVNSSFHQPVHAHGERVWCQQTPLVNSSLSRKPSTLRLGCTFKAADRVTVQSPTVCLSVCLLLLLLMLLCGTNTNRCSKCTISTVTCVVVYVIRNVFICLPAPLWMKLLRNAVLNGKPFSHLFADIYN